MNAMLTARSSLKTAWISCGGCDSTLPSTRVDLTSVSWAEGRAMTLARKVESALAAEAN